MSTEETPKFDLGSFDFTPDWAKKGAGVTVGKSIQSHADVDAASGARRPFDRERKSAGERKASFDRKPASDRRSFGERRSERREAPRAESRGPALAFEVKVLPETKALGTIIRKLQQDTHAYKLKDLAYFFLDNPSSVLLKVDQKTAEGESPVAFYQCKACSFASVNEADVIEHILRVHLSDYYESKEIEVEPPKGNFNCVARCGLSGVLLGPPNIHEFNETVREMIRTRYPEMTEADYRSRIEMVRDAEAIEEWRKRATKKTVFLSKSAGENAIAMSRTEAEGEFRRSILPTMLDTPKHLMITAEAALKSPVRPLQWAARDALEVERRAPYNMCFALRGAFHHRKMNFFRVNDARGSEFVTGLELKPFDAAHAIPELVKVATYIAENPCAFKNEIAPDAETEKQLNWLVATGHVVAFTNGAYSAVEKFPKYGPHWRKKATPAADETSAPTESAPAPVEAAPAAEVAAVEAAPAAEEPVAAQVEEAKTIEIVKEEKKDEAPAQLAE